MNQIRANAESAVQEFQDRANGPLDYSSASLQHIEDLLADASDFRDEMSPERIDALVELFGCYVLEVAFRQHGGDFRWHEARKQPVLVVGEPSFHVAIATFDKVRGRLSGDAGDNLVFFYEGFSQRATSAPPGTNALYV